MLFRSRHDSGERQRFRAFPDGSSSLRAMVAPLNDQPDRLLIVDDDPAIVRMVAEFIGRDSSYELRSAGTGYDAGLLTREFRPHLILLDYMLPDINGNEVCRRIRADADLGSIKIVIVSGVVRREEIEDLLDAGADAFLPKPIDPDLLTRRIDRLLAA